MNSIVLLGRATDSIELKQTQAGKSVVNFTLAVKRPFTKDTTDFFTICAWDKQAELISRYVKKGNQVCIRGYLTTRTWTDNQGNKRYATEVIADEVSFVASKENNESNDTSYMSWAYSQNAAKFEEVAADATLPF